MEQRRAVPGDARSRSRGEVIAGGDQGLVGVKAGERRRLVIGPDLGYGDVGQGPIPLAASMAFEVDVVEIR